MAGSARRNCLFIVRLVIRSTKVSWLVTPVTRAQLTRAEGNKGCHGNNNKEWRLIRGSVKYPKLLEPVMIGKTWIRNRIVYAYCGTSFSGAQEEVNDRVLKYYLATKSVLSL